MRICAPAAQVDHDTVNRALGGVLKDYRGQKRLEAEIKLESQIVRRPQNELSLHRQQGPGRAGVLVQGASARAGTRSSG